MVLFCPDAKFGWNRGSEHATNGAAHHPSARTSSLPVLLVDVADGTFLHELRPTAFRIAGHFYPNLPTLSAGYSYRRSSNVRYLLRWLALAGKPETKFVFDSTEALDGQLIVPLDPAEWHMFDTN